MASILQQTLGVVAPFITPIANINGMSQANWGDPVDAVETNWDWDGFNRASVGWWGNGGGLDRRIMIIYKIVLTAIEPKAEIGNAVFIPVAIGKNIFLPYTFPAGGWKLRLYEMEGVVTTAATWLLRSAGVPWYGGGYGPKRGYDFIDPELDSYTIDADGYALLGVNATSTNAASQILMPFSLQDAAQRARDERRDLYVLLTGEWGQWYKAGPMIDDPVAAATTQHTTAVIDYWPAMAVHSALELVSTRPADYTKLHDPAFAGTSNRTYLGAVEQGTLSSELKEWVVNHRTSGPRRAVAVGTSRSEATSVDSQDGLGTTLKSVDTYDRATGECSVDGDYVATQTDATHYQIAYTNSAGVTVTLLEQTTGLSSVTFAADHIFVLTGSRILKIRSIKWSATTGVAAGSTWRWSVRGDKRTTEDIDTLTMVRLLPPVVRPFGNDPDSSRARPIRNAYTQQLWTPGYHDVDIAGTIHTHLYVRDVSATDWLTTATSVDAWCEVVAPGVDTFVSAKIEAAYGSTHGTWPDEVRLDRMLTVDEKALCTPTSIFSGGVILGDLAKQQFRLLTDPAAAGTTQLVMASAFDGAVTAVRVYKDGTGASEHTVTSGGATSVLVVTPVLPVTYPVGTYVSPLVDPIISPGSMPERPYYANGKVPTAQQEGLYTGFYDVFEVRIV